MSNNKFRNVFKDKPLKIFGDDMIEKQKTMALCIPFAGHSSLSRTEMAGSAFRDIVFPIDGEVPLMDTPYSREIMRSSFNVIAKEDLTLMSGVDYTVDDTVVKTLYVLLGSETGKLQHYEFIPTMSFKHFGIKNSTVLSDMTVGDMIRKGDYINMLDGYEHYGVKVGRDLLTMYTIDPDLTEDAMKISDKAIKSLSYNDERHFVIKVSSNNSFRRFYEGGRYFPRVGEVIESGVVASVSTIDRGVLDDLGTQDIHNIPEGDKTYFAPEGSEVISIEVYGNSTDPILSEYIEQTKLYSMQVYGMLAGLSKSYDLDPLTANKLNHEDVVLDDETELTYSDIALGKDTCVIVIKTNVVHVPEIGQKLTNRYGGKGTVSSIFKHGDYIDEYGRAIDMLVATTSTFKRENPSQMFEKTLNNWSYSISDHIKRKLKESESFEKELLNLLLECHQVLGGDMLKEFKQLYNTQSAKIILSLYGDITYNKSRRLKARIYYRLPSHSSKMRMSRVLELRRVLKKYGVRHGVTNVFRITDGQKIKMSDKHELGEVYHWILENNPDKDASIRHHLGARSNSGEMIKTVKKKRGESKYADTAIKLSSLVTSVVGDSVKPVNLTELLDNGTNTAGTISALMASVGMELTTKK